MTSFYRPKPIIIAFDAGLRSADYLAVMPLDDDSLIHMEAKKATKVSVMQQLKNMIKILLN